MTVYFFLEKHDIPQYYLLLTCYVCTRLCQCFFQGGCYFRCDKLCVPAAIPEHNIFCYSAIAHILTSSANCLSGVNQVSKINVGLELVISDSGSTFQPFFDTLKAGVRYIHILISA